jgi:hypothetical protein
MELEIEPRVLFLLVLLAVVLLAWRHGKRAGRMAHNAGTVATPTDATTSAPGVRTGGVNPALVSQPTSI